MKFVMMSDTHYISRRMIADQSDAETMLQPAVTEQALRQAAENADTIIISGDLTDDGDRPSHEDFIKLLRELKAQGKKVYVIFATHDFHHHRAWVRKRGDTKAKFTSAPWDEPYFDIENVNWKDYVSDECKDWSAEDCTPQLEESVAPEELWELYREFGPDQARSCDDASFSYCIDLDENTRCLMLNDIFRNEEALHDISPTYTPTCLKWMKKEIDAAKAEGKYIFVCSHHPFVPASPVHRIGTGNRNLRSPHAGHMLADMGIDLAFTGHTHASALQFITSDKGHTMCHVSTASVRFYPPVYRLVELDGKNKKIKYENIDVNIPEGVSIEENSLREHYYEGMRREYWDKLTKNPTFGKLVENGTMKPFAALFRKKAGLTDAEYARMKETKLFDFLTSIIFDLLSGDGQFTPDTPEYRLMMCIAAAADSIVDAQPFVDLRNKTLKGYKLTDAFEDLLFQNGYSDSAAEFDFTADPGKFTETPEFTSRAGDLLMLFVTLLALPVSVLAPAAVAVGIPFMTLKKKRDLKKHPVRVIYRY